MTETIGGNLHVGRRCPLYRAMPLRTKGAERHSDAPWGADHSGEAPTRTSGINRVAPSVGGDLTEPLSGAPDSTEEASVSTSLEPAPPERVRVAVIDDSATDRALYRALLESCPTSEFEVTEYASGRAAVQSLAVDVPDCVLLDYHLDDCDAPEILALLDRVIDLSRVPTVVVTGHDDHALVQEAFRAGAIDFVTKGKFDTEALSRAIRFAIERSRTGMLRREIERSERLASIGQLAASVVHEINNPAAFVLTNLTESSLALGQLRKLLAKSNDDSIRRESEAAFVSLEEMIDDSLDGVRRIGTIVSELKLFSHLKPERIEWVDLNSVVQSAAKLMGSKLRGDAGGAQLQLRLGDLPLIAADRGKLIQVLVNLLDNAIMAVEGQPEGNRRITIRTRERGESVWMEVEDTGCGIPEYLLSRVIDPFFTTKSRGGGTGLGLSLSADYVRHHGGRLQLDSIQGSGTTIRVVLPLDTGLVVEPLSTRPPAPAPADGQVLIVDDEPQILRAFSRVLSRHYEVLTAASAAEALETIESHPDISAIVCDVSMPTCDGATFLERLRITHVSLSDRVLFCTGGTFSEEARQLLARDNRPVLTKPVEPHLLLRAVDSIARESGST